MMREQTRRAGGCVVVVAATISMAAAAAPQVSGPDEHGFRWATIGAPGNRDTLPSELPDAPWLTPMGGVDYRYRMATTEVTGSMWFEFVQAYRPYVGADRGRPYFTGPALFRGFDSEGLPTYTMDARFEDMPIGVGWRYAARFVNWLHNGKPVGDDLTEAAFAQGVYDTSTFSTNPDNSINDNTTAASGARYWIPTHDEWIKAAYYDPNHYGEGEGGYWVHPNGQNEPLTPGAPGEPGAQTGAGYLDGNGIVIPVGAYPDVDQPWGLLDVSGGSSEWTSTIAESPVPMGMYVHGTRTGTVNHDIFDAIDIFGSGRPHDLHGIRLASPIPSPGAFPVLLLAWWRGSFTRKRR